MMSTDGSIAGMPLGKTINFLKQPLERISESLWQDNTDVEILILAETGITQVPEQIGCLKKLRVLDLGHNRITRVPDSLGELTALTDFLYLHDNQLAALPDALGKLVS